MTSIRTDSGVLEGREKEKGLISVRNDRMKRTARPCAIGKKRIRLAGRHGKETQKGGNIGMGGGKGEKKNRVGHPVKTGEGKSVLIADDSVGEKLLMLG